MVPLSLEKLKITDTNIEYCEEDDLIDITKELFESLKSITDNKVVKAAPFELLEGTRALEVLNPRLDTGLIELTNEELQFDCSQPQPIDVVVNIQTKLLSNLINWLESDSLPVTVLSCRYVQTILVNYLNYHMSKVGQFSFSDARLPEKTYDTTSLDYLLVHKVLKTFIMGLSKFIGFTIYLSQTVLYEEEDLTTKSMNLNFFQELLPQFFIDEINDCIEWILSHDEIVDPDVLITQLKVVSNLVKLENSLSAPKGSNPAVYEFCNDAIAQIKKLLGIKFDESVIPNGAFSKFIQVDLENKNIPTELGHIDLDTAWSHLSGIFETTYRFTSQAHSIKTTNQLLDFLHYNTKYPIEKFSVFTRGLFQLFFIRDDKSIFGSSQMTLPTLMVDIIENFVGKNTIVLGNFESNLSQLKDCVKAELLERYTIALGDLESGVYHILTSFASNPCRLQQLLSKGLILWDTLQVSWENFEYELHKNFGIGDEFASGDLSITVTSFIYYSKLKFMVNSLLNGIALEIYKPFEMYLVYWYADYLVQNIIEHVQSRVSQIIMGKINYIETSIPKKIKKLKAGPKKEQLKQVHKHNQEVIIPQLTATLNFNQDYLVKSFQLLQTLIQCHSHYLAVLSKLQIIDFTRGPSNNLTSMESLYYLRMKPWSSIGIPNFPTYEQYQAKLKSGTFPGQNNKLTLMKVLELLANIKNNLNGLEKEYNELIGYIRRDKRDNFLKDSLITTWYEELIATIAQLNENVSLVSKIISSNKNDLNLRGKYTLQISNSHHMYFPKIIVIPK
ncbi:N-alpha-acetyltransferase, 35 NatC auxiliary subunit [Candida viswanathii]|uniref:N-alpha-acetyltransferase, 35 NatC auxiliary subunit n=1 Tax=Candida viswanathii TaxID=5486 RepID=A0A367XVB4_9ASCO|nr:N-alpha-acetyltransferase, 35 NatC auxiliary subunit [Candida viswanathii]